MNKGMLRIIIIVLVTIILFNISARGCQNRSGKVKVGSSINNTFLINAPSNLVATAISSNQIDLSWQDNSNNEDGFEIGRSPDGTNYEIIVTINNTVPSYSDNTIFPLVNYYYQIRAFNSVGDRSSWSNEVSVFTGVSMVAAGDGHSLALANNGLLLAWGNNDYGQLGDPDIIDSTVPNQIGTNMDWSKIAAGFYHSLAIKTNGTLWGWGSNDSGQLAVVVSIEYILTPTAIGTVSDWIKMTAGSNHSVGLKTDGTIWSWGWNLMGQLGLGYTNPSTVTAQTRIGTATDWVNIWAGAGSTFALKSNRTLWAWGWNAGAQLGVSDMITKTTPTKVGISSDWAMVGPGFEATIACKTDGTLWKWGGSSIDPIPTPAQIGNSTDWVAVTTGGADYYSTHMLARKIDGTLWSWGYNTNGELGLGDWCYRGLPTQIGNDSDWSSIATGNYDSMGMKTNGTILHWGGNQYGQLGLGDTINRNILRPPANPVPPSGLSAVVITSNRIDLLWNDNSANELGFKIERKFNRNSEYEQIAVVNANITSWADLLSLSAGTYYYRITSLNNFGSSAYSNEAYTALSGTWVSFALGSDYTIARKTNNTLWSWGRNSSGQLGVNDTVDRYVSTQIGTSSDWFASAAGNDHTIALKTSNTLWAWGKNEYGQLGTNDTIQRNSPAQVGTNSDWLALTGTNLSAFAVGSYHTLAMKTNRTLWSWGPNAYGQLGTGNYTQRISPIQVGTASDWAGVAAGYLHSLAIKTNNTLWVWGDNNNMELGDLSLDYTEPSPVQIGSADWSIITGGCYYTNALKTNGTLWGCGRNDYGQIGNNGVTNFWPFVAWFAQAGTHTNWSSIAACPGTLTTSRGLHTIALKTNNTLWSWGFNFIGQLGLGDSGINRLSPTQIGIGSDWIKALAGGGHSGAIKANGTLWLWGDNNTGQLGIGNPDWRLIQTLVGE